MANTLRGWQKLAIFAGVGCASILGVLVVGVIVAAMWARATVANLGDTTPQRVERRIALPSPAVTAERAPEPIPGGTARLQLTLDLQEASFVIRPGEPGSGVQLQGTYAPGLYELTEASETDPATSTQRTNIRFRSKAPAWARFFASIGSSSEERPQLTVTIPRAAPIDLVLRLSMGRSDVDLGGLTLGEVSVNVSMGEHRIDFLEPVVEGVRDLRFTASMGNVSIAHLGNARANTITTSGSMGNLTADLGGAWPPGSSADLTFEHSMGELTLRVPSGVRLDAEVRSGDDSEQPAESFEQPDDPQAPQLHLRVNTSMGNSRVIRY